MGLLSKFFSKDKKINKAEQKLNQFLSQNLPDKADNQFCNLFTLLVKEMQWQHLSKVITNYLPKVQNQSIVELKVGNELVEQALKALEKNNFVPAAIQLAIFVDKHPAVIELYAKSANYNELFMHISANKQLMTRQMVGLALEKWEQYNGKIKPNTPIVNILQGIDQENTYLIPEKAHLKESIGKYEEAANLYLSQLHKQDAARCFELANQSQKAIELYAEIGANEKVSVIAEKLGDYALALSTVVKPERKFDLLVLTEQLQEAKQFALGFASPNKFVEKVKTEAKRLIAGKVVANEHIQALEYAQLAELEPHETAQMLEEGRKYYTQKQLDSNDAGSAKAFLQKRITLEEKTGNYHVAARIAEEELKDSKLAIKLYEKANLYHKAIVLTSENEANSDSVAVKTRLAELHSKGGNLFKAADLYEGLGKYEEAYRLYDEVGHFEKALACYTKLPDKNEQTLLDLYRKVGAYDQIIDLHMAKNSPEALQEALRIARERNDAFKVGVIEKKLSSFKAIPDEELEASYQQALQHVDRQYAPILGIDFGTSTSVCAVYNVQTRKVEVVTNEKGNQYIDSYLAINEEGRYIFGNQAKLLRLTKPLSVVSHAKRFLGDNKIFHINNKSYSTEEIIAHQLSNLKRISNNYLKTKVKERFTEQLSTRHQRVPSQVVEDFFQQKNLDVIKEVVLTVPAYFNDSQKRATKDAAEIAGLNVRRLLHEPTSAAVAFEFQKSFKGKMAVLDLGGGTFDISILDISEGVFEVEKIGGNTQLGGSDLDELVYAHFLQKIKQEHGVDLSEASYKVEAARLKDACENLKINLSTQQEYIIEMPYFLNQPSFSFSLTRPQLEAICQPFWQKYTKVIQETLQDLTVPVQGFILVGNATKMPKIVQLSTEAIQAKQSKGIDPGLVVASGAAIDGAILTDHIKDKVILDVVPFSLGISVQENENSKKQVISRIIQRNLTIPVSRESSYSTTFDNQDTVSIRIYQGESEEPEANHFLGQFQLSGLPPAKAGTPKIKVTFDISADCILTVTAEDEATQKSQSIQVLGSVRLSYAQKQALVDKFKQKESSQVIESQVIRLKNELDQKIDTFEKQHHQFKQNKTRLEALVEEKLQLNPQNYQANVEQAQVINDLFLQKDQLMEDAQRYLDQFTSLASNVQNATKIHLDFTDTSIKDNLRERKERLQQFLKNAAQLNERFQTQVMQTVDLWINTLDSIDPNLEKMTVLEKANYLMATDRVQEAIALLETNIEAHATDAQFIEALLKGYRKNGDVQKYKEVAQKHKFILGNEMPDFNHLNKFLQGLTQSVFMIEVYDKYGKIGTGSGFGVSDHFIVTTRHLVEGNHRLIITGEEGEVISQNVILDTNNDLALIRVQTPLKSIRMGFTEFIEPGDWVMSVGILLNDSNTFAERIGMTQGDVNAIRKHEMSTDRLIFMDNKIEEGMVGGPLVSSIGEVLGVVTFTQYRVAGVEAGFGAMQNQPVAIPIHLVEAFVERQNRES
ncbi:hypothetical protein BKI52_22295 [marine bacterium AO1-C]|nr:hypothetical protein BKI52_22295 [marine bacterium AO1-C]